VGGSITNSPAVTLFMAGGAFAASAGWAMAAERPISSVNNAIFNASPRLRCTIPQ